MNKYIENYKQIYNDLVIYLKGEINSTTSLEVEQAIMKVANEISFTTLILDFSLITYVSSAGLRVILRLKQHYNDMHIVNVSLSVYDVFSMTGFTNIMDIKKTLTKIDVKDKEIIGEGYFSTVYRIDSDTIVKAFKEDVDIKEVERELNMAKQAFILGIPTAISFDVVQVNDKLGVRFELLNSTLLRDLFRDYPEDFDQLVIKYVDLLKKINTTETLDESLLKTKDFWINKLEQIKEYLPIDKYDLLKEMLEEIPDRDTFVHGDCHVKNIMVQGDELFLIDMDTLTRGHPIFELACICATYALFEEDDIGSTAKFLGLPIETVNKLYDQVINQYFGKDDKDIKNKIRMLGYLHMVWWTNNYQKDNKVRFNNCKIRLLNLLETYHDFNVGI